MERNFYTNDFERLLKERSDEFRMYPSKRVWHSIYNDLHPGRKWPSVAVSLLLIAALLITGYWNSNNHTTTSIVASSNNLHTGIAGQVNYSAPVTQQAVVLNTYNPNANNTVAIISSKQNAVNAVTNSNIGNANSASVIVYSSNTKRTAEKRAYNRIVDNNGNSNTSAAQNSMLIYSGQINTLSVNTAFNTTFNSGNSVSTTDKATSKNTDLPNGVKSNSAVVNTKSAADLIPVNTKTAANENNIDAGISTIPVDKINDIPIVESVVQSGSDQKIEAAVVTIAIDTKVKAAGQLTLSTQDKAWMDDYAFYNRSTRKKWKDRVAKEFYITPGIGFRSFSNNSSFNAVTVANTVTVPYNINNLNTDLHQKPGLGLEAGIGLVYSLSKKLRVKAGIQANYTSYTIYGEETNHPVLTTLRLTNINTGFPYLDSRTATLANSGLNTAKTHNNTYQISIPLGLAIKLAGTDKLQWYAGASIQPSFVVNGKANMISDDRKNYVADPALLRRWNLNSGVETYIHYKMNGFTLQAGPQFRYQLLSTYSSQYTINENLYNLGLKIGILKNF